MLIAFASRQNSPRHSDRVSAGRPRCIFVANLLRLLLSLLVPSRIATILRQRSICDGLAAIAKCTRRRASAKFTPRFEHHSALCSCRKASITFSSLTSLWGEKLTVRKWLRICEQVIPSWLARDRIVILGCSCHMATSVRHDLGERRNPPIWSDRTGSTISCGAS